MLWYVDVLGYLLAGKFPIGVAAFLAWPETKLVKKLTTTHHLWFIPLAFFMIYVILIYENLGIIFILTFYSERQRKIRL